MSGCLDDVQLDELIDSRCPEDTQKSAWEHLRHCASCGERFQQLKTADGLIRDLARALRKETVVAAVQIEVARSRLMDSLQGPECGLAGVAEGALSLRRLLLLQKLVRPACGPRLATRAIIEAANSTPQAVSSRLRWNAFLVRLSELLSDICGETMARMVIECGEQIRWSDCDSIAVG